MWQSWAGYAFEGICLKHADNIIKKLGLDSVGYLIGSWKYIPMRKSEDSDAQIDLLFDQNDNAITVREIKYSSKVFNFDKTNAKKLINKINVFQKQTMTKKQIFLVLVTT